MGCSAAGVGAIAGGPAEAEDGWLGVGLVTADKPFPCGRRLSQACADGLQPGRTRLMGLEKETASESCVLSFLRK